MPAADSSDVQILATIIEALEKADPAVRRRILQTVATFFRDGETGSTRQSDTIPVIETSDKRRSVPFSDDRIMSPKAFLLEKQPRTDVERVATLAFYLTHFRDTPHFRTVDLTKLNTEAAQPRMSNPAWATSNAVKRGYLAQATKGMKQLSAAGEQFVMALPDRDSARSAMAVSRPRRRKQRKSKQGTPKAERA